MGLWSWLTGKRRGPNVKGSLQYIPGSTSFGSAPVELEDGELKRRQFVQPDAEHKEEHSNIPIFTGNPFRQFQGVASAV